jgi:hypothetical protein
MDQLHEVDCVGPCDASMVLGVDATTADTQAPDVTVPDSQPDTTTTLSTDAGADGPSEGTDSGNAADAEAGCPVTNIVCDGSCVDPATDSFNCNGCGNICHTGACGVALAADMKTPPPATWLFNGTAQYLDAGPSAAMTVANTLYQAGTVIYRNAIVVDEFTANFDFRMGYGGGARNDGMAFMFEQTSPTAVGTFGESLAVVGLGGYGVEFDINDNDSCGDVSNDQLGVDSLANCPTADPLPTSLFSTDLTAIIDMADATWHHAVVVLQGGAISVQVDGSPFASAVALPEFDAGARYYFGFGGATGGIGPPDGGGGYQTEVRNVAIAFPTPRCL